MVSQQCPPFDRLYYLPLQDRINDLVEKFPLQKSKKSRAKKNAAGDLVLPLPTNSSFQIVDGSVVWDFFVDDIEDSRSWCRSLTNAFQAFELNKMLDQQIDENAGQPAVATSSSTTTLNNSNAGKGAPSLTQGFVILSGTYGRIGHDKHSKDVTGVLRDLVKQQGGAQLVLKAGPKKEIFGNPAEGKKKHLSIISRATAKCVV